MKKIPISNLGAVGVVTDLPPHLLPPNAWTRAQNVRFFDGSPQRIFGHARYFNNLAVTPVGLWNYNTGPENWFIYASLAKVFGISGGVHYDLTRVASDYAGQYSRKWNGGVLGGVLVLNNGFDVPQYWATPAGGTKLQDLANWPAGTIARVVKPYKQFLVAGNITKAGTNYPHLVKWSHPAIPGGVPSSWDETDPSKDAGEYPLIETQDPIIDMVTLRDALVIYKEKSTYAMSYIGGLMVHRFSKLFGSFGLLADGCAADLDSRHIAVSRDDIVLHDGQQMTSVLNKRIRRSLFTRLDTTNYFKAFCAYNPINQEVWFCFPESGNQWCNMALVIALDSGALSFRDVPNVSALAYAKTDISDTWDSQALDWTSDNAAWDSPLQVGLDQRFLGVSPLVATDMYAMDYTFAFLGVPFTSVLERKFMTFGDSALDSPSRVKQITRVIPNLEYQGSGEIEITLGTSQRIDQPMVWGTPVVYKPSRDYACDIKATAPCLGIRFQATDGYFFRLKDYEVFVSDVGALNV